MNINTQVLIIGAGVTGAGLMRDLALRGISSVLVEKGDINAGASGGNHGLLHSGARYIESDPAAAKECRIESAILKKTAPHCIEETGGLFVSFEGDDPAYAISFPERCSKSGIAVTRLTPEEALSLEPSLSKRITHAYKVKDASVDPFKLSIDNISHAESNGGLFLPYKKVVRFDMEKKRIRRVYLNDTKTGEESTVTAEIVVSATGAWAGKTAALAGITINMLFSKGSLLVTHKRITKHVINRLRHPSDGDILVPGGTVSILGTTSVRVDSPDCFRPTIPEVDHIITEGAVMIPGLETTRYIRAYSGIRPLVLSTSPASSHDTGVSGGDGNSDLACDDRDISRGFTLIDHTCDGVGNFITITGGKLTTYRLMAEKTADIVCRRLGVTTPSITGVTPLPPGESGKYTEPGLAPRLWIKNNDSGDTLLCECEMVSQSMVDTVLKGIKAQHQKPSLKAVGLRSRIGKGSCQGGFCSMRVAAYMYDKEAFNGRGGISDLKAFLDERWRGQKPLMWGASIIQAELQEALHCGLFSLELAPPFITSSDSENGR